MKGFYPSSLFLLLLASTTGIANAQQGGFLSALRRIIKNLFGGGGNSGNEGSGLTCEYDSSNSSDNSCSLSSLQVKGERLSLFPGGSTRCGRDVKSNGEPNPYFFQVDPGRNGKEDNVVIAFQGGGAFLGFESGDAGGRTSPELQKKGIFDLDRTDNPVKDWTRVVITYCTGDVHTGNGVDIDPSDGSEYRFNGRNNVFAVLDWIQMNIPNPERVYLYGSSAGSLGVQLWSSKIISDYKSLPNPPMISVTADSGSGLQNPESSSSTDMVAVDLWKTCSSDLGLTASEVSQCEQGLLSLADIPLKAQANNRDVPFSFVNFKFDPVVYKNYCEGSIPCVPESELYGLQKEFLKGFVQETDNNVLFYWITAIGHVIVKGDKFYSVVEGISLRDFIENQVTYEAGQVLQSDCQDTNIPGNFPFDAGCDPQLLAASFTTN